MSKLEEIGREQRDKLAPKNVYNSSDTAKNYSSTHPNAKAHDHGSDDPRDLKGKGTGIYLDTNPDNATGAGGYQDIFGNDSDIGSGRIKNVLINKYKSTNEYTQPIIGGNVNQYTNPG